MPKTFSVRQLVGVVGAVIAGVALSRFTGGDWESGTIATALVAGLGAWYFLDARRPKDTRRY